jgi:predicted ArsR family transcriptional regulator
MDKKNRCAMRERVLAAWKADPYRTVFEFAKELGISAGSVSGHLIALDKAGLIKRKKLVRKYNHGMSPGAESRAWAVASKKATRPYVNHNGKKSASKIATEEERIEDVIKKALANGTAWTGGAPVVMRKDIIGGCKVG